MKKILFLAPVFGLLASFTTLQQTTPEIPADVKPLLEKHNCVSCHTMGKKLVGPSWEDLAAKGYSKKRIVTLIQNPEPGNWPGYPPMAAQFTNKKDKAALKELDKIAAWLVSLKSQK